MVFSIPHGISVAASNQRQGSFMPILRQSRQLRPLPGRSRTSIYTFNINCYRQISTNNQNNSKSLLSSIGRKVRLGALSVLGGAILLYTLQRSDLLQSRASTKPRNRVDTVSDIRSTFDKDRVERLSALPFYDNEAEPSEDGSAWGTFTSGFSTFSSLTNTFTEGGWASITDNIADFVVPKWAKAIPGSINKLQRELSMAPGSLAQDIWNEAHDPSINPEIMRDAKVRVSLSSELCDEEKVFLALRRGVVTAALAKYLGLPLDEVNPDDVPTIALVGSGGGLRACVAGAGSYLAASEAGLWDCTTFTAGVSGSCWLQAIYNSSLGGRRFDKVVKHLQNRIGTHIAYPPVAFSALNSAPTNKFLLSGFVEKLRGDANADFGLVDIYGLLLAARLLVPKGELGIDDRDLKISNQRDYIKHGENPLPIYTTVRHEIPIIEQSSSLEKATGSPSEATKEQAKEESWFQWFEITPYELFCEEFAAGIPTWALGRKFKGGHDLPQDEGGLRVPELRLPTLMGIFGSAFCATLSHYYKEVRPLIKSLTGFGSIDEVIETRNNDMKKVHPIEPASIPNFAYGMEGQLAPETPPEIYKSERIQLMDAGMSNNLPIYPLLRPGRDVDVIVVFDASADIRTENWISLAEGYAKQRGIKGWPIGAGWPPESDTAEKAAGQLDDAQAQDAADADAKISKAKIEQDQQNREFKNATSTEQPEEPRNESKGLGYCTVWVGTTQERENTDASKEKPTSKYDADDWQLMEPDAGIAVIYFPFLPNPKVKGVDPVTSPFMSTWNFIYTPEDVDKVVALAKANFEEGKEKTRRTIRAVYERRKKTRETREAEAKTERFRRKMRLGMVGRKGEGDHFS